MDADPSQRLHHNHEVAEIDSDRPSQHNYLRCICLNWKGKPKRDSDSAGAAGWIPSNTTQAF